MRPGIWAFGRLVLLALARNAPARWPLVETATERLFEAAVVTVAATTAFLRDPVL